MILIEEVSYDRELKKAASLGAPCRWTGHSRCHGIQEVWGAPFRHAGAKCLSYGTWLQTYRPLWRIGRAERISGKSRFTRLLGHVVRACRMEIPELVALQEKYGERGLRIIGIAVDDDPQSVREFRRSVALDYPVALADDATQALYGGIQDLPTLFLIGRDGRVYAGYAGAVPASGLDSDIRALLDARKGGPPPAIARASVESAGLSGDLAPDMKPEQVAASKAEYAASSSQERCTCGCAMDRGRCGRSSQMCGSMGKSRK
jgi:thiol-disulfide isomerase/thioredoxin